MRDSQMRNPMKKNLVRAVLVASLSLFVAGAALTATPAVAADAKDAAKPACCAKAKSADASKAQCCDQAKAKCCDQAKACCADAAKSGCCKAGQGKQVLQSPKAQDLAAK